MAKHLFLYSIVNIQKPTLISPIDICKVLIIKSQYYNLSMTSILSSLISTIAI